MSSKLKRYITYIKKFASSSEKKELIQALNIEITKKGFSGGVKSFLHKRMNAKGDEYRGEDGIQPFKTQLFDRSTRVVLPAIASPKVSVIVPMYNELNYTFDCINSVFLNCGISDYEIIVADDNSTQDSNLLKKSFENLVVIRNPANLGFLKNCNNAARQARGEYLVFLNNDTYVLKDWLRELLDVFSRFEGVGVAGSKLMYPDGRLQEAGGIMWRDGSAWNYGNGGNPGAPAFNYTKETDYVSGASLMISRRVWEEAGGFDELFAPAYCEDSDLCFKVRAMGYKVMYEPCSVVVHFEGVTHGTDTGKGIKKHQALNQEKFVQKWQAALEKKAPNGMNVLGERDRSTGRKGVMVVDHYLPQVDKDAGSRTISNFLQALTELGYMVHFLGENQNVGERYRKYYQQQGIEVLYGSEYNFFDQSWKKYVTEHLDQVDVFLLSRSSVCVPFMTFLRECNYQGKIIYYGHDLGFVRLEKEAAANNDEHAARQAKRIKAAEDYMYHNADYALYISDEEAAYLKQYVVTPLKYVPPYFFHVLVEQIPFDKREGLLFVGGFNHPPNQDAMRWFLDDIYPVLHSKGIRMNVVGSKMPAFLYDYQKKYPLLMIKPDATEAELDELYKTVRLAVVPLRHGAGVKGKVIEAMAKGVPVAGTTVAFEGMPKPDGFPYTGADDAEALAAQILDLYNDAGKWQCLASFGTRYVQGHYNKEVMKGVFREIVETPAPKEET